MVEGVRGRQRAHGRAALANMAPAACLVLALCAPAPAVYAQASEEPALRVMGTTVRGVRIDGAAAYPVSALEALGFQVRSAPAGVMAVHGADTLRFWNTSPYFRLGGNVGQLAFPASEHAGGIHLPEQFFIQWLPSAFPGRYAFQGGAVVAPGSSVRLASSPRPPAAAPRAAEQQASRTAAAHRRIVVIDPGHGGRDPGRVGPGGLREKDVTLSISHLLATLLRERGYEVHLTRTNDTYVSLPDRPKLANQWKGDAPVAVFLSIHANAAPSTSVKGFETFFLSEARTDDERRVAEMENAAIHFDDHPPAAADGGLDRVLNTLRSDFLMRASHDLAAVVQDRMAGFHPGPNRGVKRAGFYVLVGSIMPSVLIETGFISNRDEARLLGTDSFQNRMARGIADSVDEFFQRNEHLWEQAK